MADELTGQQVTTPAPEQTKDAAETPAESGKFAGKEKAEVERAYNELERKLGEQGSTMGQLKATNEQLQTALQQVAAYMQQQQAQAQRPAEAQVSRTNTPFDWEKPDASVEAIADRKVKEAMSGLYRQLRTEQAVTASQFAEQQAKTQFPQLFEGATAQEVRAFMQQQVNAGVVAPNAIENPLMWAQMAWAMKGQKSGFGATGATTNPIAPDESDRPNGSRNKRGDDDGEPIELSREHEDAIRAFGLDKDKFIKGLRADRKEKGRR
jgi:hypothetical protein